MSVHKIYGFGISHDFTNEQTNENQVQIKIHFKEINQQSKK